MEEQSSLLWRFKPVAMFFSLSCCDSEGLHSPVFGLGVACSLPIRGECGEWLLTAWGSFPGRSLEVKHWRPEAWWWEESQQSRGSWSSVLMKSTAAAYLVSLSLASGCFLAKFTLMRRGKIWGSKVGGKIHINFQRIICAEILFLSNYLSIRMK